MEKPNLTIIGQLLDDVWLEFKWYEAKWWFNSVAIVVKQD